MKFLKADILMVSSIILLVFILILTGCTDEKKKNTGKIESSLTKKNTQNKMVPVNTKNPYSYKNIKSIEENIINTITSTNKIVKIDKKNSYYDVIIDLEKGSHFDAGKGYGEAIKSIYPNYARVMESYLYENIKYTFKELEGNYTPVKKRLDTMIAKLKKPYLDEIDGLTESLVEVDNGFAMDGKLSKEEIQLMNLVPDLLRSTQCSGVAIYGDKSVTGKTMTARILEWSLGNDKQISTAHAVVHFKNKSSTFTSYGILGLMNVITAKNESGVFAGILDSGTGDEFEIEGKKSYTFELRNAIETYKNAKDVGEYLVSNGKTDTFSHNVLLSDPREAFIAEICVGKKGVCLLRSEESKLTNSIKWDNKNSVCVVNGFALENNYDNFTSSPHNIIRWNKYNQRLLDYEKVDANDLKDILTVDDPNNEGHNLYSNRTIQMIIYNSATNETDMFFSSTKDSFPLKPEFVMVK